MDFPETFIKVLSIFFCFGLMLLSFYVAKFGLSKELKKGRLKGWLLPAFIIGYSLILIGVCAVLAEFNVQKWIILSIITVVSSLVGFFKAGINN